jgi:methylthioribose-1-phosphate isomerase
MASRCWTSAPCRSAATGCRWPDAPAVADAIRALIVRGAPAIGIAAGYGLVLAARALAQAPLAERIAGFAAAAAMLRAARPTAVNLMWAVDRMLASCGGDPQPEAVLARGARDRGRRPGGELPHGPDRRQLHRSPAAAC